MKTVDLKVSERRAAGSAEARRLRRTGMIPGVFYGGGNESIPLSIDARVLKKALAGEGGNVILNLTIDGRDGTHPAILKEYQSDALGRGLLHVDFMEIRMDKPIEASVHIELTGTAAGVSEGGVMDQTLREVRVRCLPADIPSSIAYAVDGMEIGDSIKVGDLAPPPEVEILDEEDIAVASVIPPTILKEEPTEEELEEELEEGEEAEAAEGEEAAAGEEGEAESEAAEPEQG